MPHLASGDGDAVGVGTNHGLTHTTPGLGDTVPVRLHAPTSMVLHSLKIGSVDYQMPYQPVQSPTQAEATRRVGH